MATSATHTVLEVEEIVRAGFKHNVYKLTCGVFVVMDTFEDRIEECCNKELDAIEVAEELDRRAE